MQISPTHLNFAHSSILQMGGFGSERRFCRSLRFRGGLNWARYCVDFDEQRQSSCVVVVGGRSSWKVESRGTSGTLVVDWAGCATAVVVTLIGAFEGERLLQRCSLSSALTDVIGTGTAGC